MTLKNAPITKAEKDKAIKEALAGQLSPATARLLGLAREAKTVRDELAAKRAQIRRSRLTSSPYKATDYASPEVAAQAKDLFDQIVELRKSFHGLIALSSFETRTEELFKQNFEKYQTAIKETREAAEALIDKYEALPKKPKRWQK